MAGCETWLKNNRRLYHAAAAIAALIAAACGMLWFAVAASLAKWALAVAALVATCAGVGLLLAARMPRIGYGDGRLWVFLRVGGCIRIPIEVVECFLLEEGPAFLPGTEPESAESINLVVRLREKAEDWAQREVAPWLGSWCGSHIVVRGSWCEPLDIPLVNRLNERLHEAKQTQKESAAR